MELVVGLMSPLNEGRAVPPFISFGVAAVYWFTDSSEPPRRSVNPLAEMEAGLLFKFSTRVALLLGARVDAVFDDSDEAAAFAGGVGGVSVRFF